MLMPNHHPDPLEISRTCRPRRFETIDVCEFEGKFVRLSSLSALSPAALPSRGSPVPQISREEWEQYSRSYCQ